MQSPPDGWLERFSDCLNPVFVWEVRRMLKSRLFAVGLMAMILMAWWLAVVSALRMSNGFYSGGSLLVADSVRSLSGWFLLLLVVPNFVVIPFLAFFNFRADLDERNEPVWMSPLHSTTLVEGKFLAGLLHALLYLSTLGPLFCMAYLFSGIGLGELLLSVFVLGCGTVALLGVAFGLATFAKSPVSTAVTLGMLLFAGYLLFRTCCGIVWQAVTFGAAVAELVGAGLTAAVISVMPLGLGWAIAETRLHLRFRPGANRLDFFDWPHVRQIATAAQLLAQCIHDSFPIADEEGTSPSRGGVRFSTGWTQTIHAAFHLEKLLQHRRHDLVREAFLVPEEADPAMRRLLTSLDSILRLYSWTGLALGISQLEVSSKAREIPRGFPRIRSALLAEFTDAANTLAEVCRQHEQAERSSAVAVAGTRDGVVPNF